MSDEDRQARLRKLGRRLGIIVFALIVATFTVTSSVQIILQVWSPPAAHAPASCHAGIGELLIALRRARDAAAAESGGERAALERFRAALLPAWENRAEIDELCRTNGTASRALSQLTALRYAEEHAVRYEAVALAEQRRRVDAITRELLGPSRAF